ncbi:glycosyltransferase family 4 protein [Marisediminicola antarctica]|uniref:Glycosyl transferase family 1 domain-containing protein n=1 Tax=Marisediminicola antarctica TaxID=674079 RepID=A0A7L5AEJ7_9MICO|nr:glycosyltransferase family 4 protein [Marisediminicola antarctica]QHO68808.1 hypothetical protein BHD05_03295 [Marisediminicola antarctica]
MTSALIVYPFMPSYRYGVFTGLDASDEFEYTFASDVSSDNGVPVLPPSVVKRHVLVRTTRIGSATWQRGLLPHIAKNKYEIVIFLGDVSHLSTWVAAGILRARGAKVFYWTIGWHNPEAGLKRLIRLAFYRLANKLLLYGETARSLGVMHGYPQARMVVIGNSHVSPPRLGERRMEGDASVKSAFPIVGAVIRLNQVKRLDLLIRAAAELKRRGDPITVVLVGEGPARGGLEHLASGLGVDVRFLGAIYDRDAVARLYTEILVTVVPSAVGLTAIQSLHHGVPVVTDGDAYTQMPEWEAVRDGVTGGLFAQGKVSALADEISRWLRMVATDRDGIAVRCRAEVETRWSPAVQTRRIEQALRGD